MPGALRKASGGLSRDKQRNFVSTTLISPTSVFLPEMRNNPITPVANKERKDL